MLVLCHVWANHRLKRNVIYDKVIQHRDHPNGLKNLHNPDVLIFFITYKSELAFPNVLDILTVAIFLFLLNRYEKNPSNGDVSFHRPLLRKNVASNSDFIVLLLMEI